MYNIIRIKYTLYFRNPIKLNYYRSVWFLKIVTHFKNYVLYVNII